MAPHLPFSVDTGNLSTEERVAFILELTRRLELLDELLAAAREKRRSIHREISSREISSADAHGVSLEIPYGPLKIP